MEDYNNLDPTIKFSVLSRWFLTSLAAANTASACDPEIATTLASEPCQGYAIAEFLNFLDSDFFNQDFLSNIQNIDYKSDYRIKLINLKRVVAAILNYYEQVMEKGFSDDFQNNYLFIPDHVQEIIEDKTNYKHRAMLLQLILGIAVNNADQVALIMSLEPEDQGIVAACINHLMSGQVEVENSNQENDNRDNLENADHSDNSINNDVQNNSPQKSTKSPYRNKPSKSPRNFQNNENDSSSEHNNSISNDHSRNSSETQNKYLQKIHNLENNLQQVAEHKHQLEAENEQLQERLQALTNNEFFQAESDQYQQKVKSLQDRLNEIQDENYRLELLKDEYAAKVSSLSNQVQILMEESKEKDLRFDDVNLMQDELDFLQREAERAATLEASVESMKRRMVDYDALKAKVKVRFGSQNLQIISFEEKLKLNHNDLTRSSNDREQLAVLKVENRDLQQKATDEKSKREKLTFENKQLQETLKAAHAENERLKGDLDNFASFGNKNAGDGSGSENGDNLGNLEGLESKTNQHSEHSQQLENQLNLANDRILELQNQYDEALKKQAETMAAQQKLDDQSNKNTDLENEVNQLKIKLEYMNKNNNDLNGQLDEITKASQENEVQLNEKISLLNQKEQDMKSIFWG